MVVSGTYPVGAHPDVRVGVFYQIRYDTDSTEKFDTDTTETETADSVSRSQYFLHHININVRVEITGYNTESKIPGDPQDARGWTSTKQKQDQSRIGLPRSGNTTQQ